MNKADEIIKGLTESVEALERIALNLIKENAIFRQQNQQLLQELEGWKSSSKTTPSQKRPAKQPMTGAERQRKYKARKKANLKKFFGVTPKGGK